MSFTADNISIRKASVDDAVLISVLASTTFYEAYFEQDESSNLAGYIHESFDIETVQAEIEDPRSTFFLIFLGGKAVGYARLIDDSTTDGVADNRVVELKRIYILERVWRTGIGDTLLMHCVKTVRDKGFAVIWLGVWEENRRARNVCAVARLRGFQAVLKQRHARDAHQEQRHEARAEHGQPSARR